MELSNQNGGFVMGTLIQMIQKGLKIKHLMKRFKLIGVSIQDILRDSFKKNGLYDICVVISSVSNNDENFKKKSKIIIESNNLTFFKDINLKFIHTSKDLQNELENLRNIVNGVAEYFGGEIVLNDLSEAVKLSQNISLEESRDLVDELGKDMKKKSFFSKLTFKKKKQTTYNDKYEHTYDHLIQTYDKSDKKHKAAKLAKMAIKIETKTALLENGLRQFNLAAQQFQIEFMYYGIYNKNQNQLNLELINYSIELSEIITNCNKNDLKGIANCVSKYMKNKKNNINLTSNTINDQIQIFLKYFPELIDIKYREQINYIDYTVINTVIETSANITLLGGNYYNKYKKYEIKYLELQKKYLIIN